MKIVGLTGGIGSGKTTAANMFRDLGIPIYIADAEAKQLINSSEKIKNEIIQLFGSEAYKYDKLNKRFISNKVFKDKGLLDKMNAIVHPRVALHFKQWVSEQDVPYVIKEAAILFESGSYKDCDLVITVTAPLDVRIKRVMARDDTSEEQVQSIVSNQWTDEQREKQSDFVLVNDTLRHLAKQVKQIHSKIVNFNG